MAIHPVVVLLGLAYLVTGTLSSENCDSYYVGAGRADVTGPSVGINFVSFLFTANLHFIRLVLDGIRQLKTKRPRNSFETICESFHY